MTILEDVKEKRFKKFKKLDEEWRSETLSRKTEELYDLIQKKAMNNVQLKMAMDFDQDLKSLKEQVKTAQEPYTTGIKTNTLEIEFAVETLRSRGEDVPDVADFLRNIKKEDEPEDAS